MKNTRIVFNQIKNDMASVMKKDSNISIVLKLINMDSGHAIFKDMYKKIVSILSFITKQMIYWGIFTVVYAAVVFSLAGQMYSYLSLPFTWVFAPILISVFGYSVGKIIGVAWTEAENMPTYYRTERKKFEYKLKSSDIRKIYLGQKIEHLQNTVQDSE
ncbi:hypothetical protein MUK72_03500 [Halococcus dombrowskii]|uniref:Uncharacterized protein n=1 Tax=Halococcus dombrowskii TaxID=179637 RepID=A0AAV3SH05_HALDO|nr:hypothetical protein [Halococcus dombrowskii]UOO95781.1 hypothetical protein MUK72_03500 [Halococcus dombrowskii]